MFLAKGMGLLSDPWVEIAMAPVKSLVILAHALFYATSLILLHAKGHFRGLFKVFSYVGRMSLTNYMMHTLFFLLLMYGPGLGLLGKVSYAHGALSSVCIYAGQAVFSWWWLQRFHYGPVEWVWRQLSYGRRFPIRRVPAVSTRPV